MSDELHKASEQYVGIANGEIVCHTGIIHFPLKKGAKRVHRLVVLPDYQGIGIGTTFIKEVAKTITERGFELNLTTTTPSLVNALKKDGEWTLARYGRVKGSLGSLNGKKHLENSSSRKRVTYSFWYNAKTDKTKRMEGRK